MFKTKYYLNPETLRFEKVNKSFRKRIGDTLFIMIILLILSAAFRIGFDHIADSPKVNYFIEKNSELQTAYNELRSQIKSAEGFLYEVEKRDDWLYRSVLDLTPIPPSIREAGSGGSENFSDMLLTRSVDYVNETAKYLEKLANKVKIQTISLYDIFQIANMHQELIAGKPSIQPISPVDSFWLTSTYGIRWDPFTKSRRMHQGIDIAGRIGLKIYATGDGIVSEASISRYGYGKEILINHGYGYSSRYAHLHKIIVEPGQRVKRGQLIGLLGSTGRSTGPHLHYEVRLDGKPLHPMYFYYENLSPEEYGEIVAQTEN